MKRIILFCIVLLLLFPALSLGEVSFRTMEENGENYVLSYPAFSETDEGFNSFLAEKITEPIRAMVSSPQEGQNTTVSFQLCQSFPNLLSVLATAKTSASGQSSEYSFFTATADLANRKLLSMNEVFDTDEAVIRSAIQSQIYEQYQDQGLFLSHIQAPEDIPVFSSLFFLDENGLTLPYPRGTLSESPVLVTITLDVLPFTVITPVAPTPTPTATPSPTPLPVTDTPMPTQELTPAPAATLIADFQLTPVTTPSPMPLSVTDSETVSVLTHGLWKPLGENGDVYYQFTEDGKLLTIHVEAYTIQDGQISSSSLNGSIEIGSDSAFTYEDENGNRSAYVLNRQGDRVAPEEFVTPSPTPVPTPTPAPTSTPEPTPTPTATPVPTVTASPTPTPSPTPSPSPTPTLSPYEQAEASAPELTADIGASFKRIKTLDVYTAPGTDSYRIKGANVTTDQRVTIYGTEGNWVLVGYSIGNGKKGRIGYIENTTLADADTVQSLDFVPIDISLTRQAKATDDPLHSESTVTTLESGRPVRLLAFFEEKWAYVEFEYEGKTTRLFIPKAAIQD